MHSVFYWNISVEVFRQIYQVTIKDGIFEISVLITDIEAGHTTKVGAHRQIEGRLRKKMYRQVVQYFFFQHLFFYPHRQVF